MLPTRVNPLQDTPDAAAPDPPLWARQVPRLGLGLALPLAIGASAAGRLRAMESLSPPDLAFFHQATWSAARGLGFAQTALEFDRGTLTGSVHLSLIRALWVPAAALGAGPAALCAAQGAVVGLSALILAWGLRGRAPAALLLPVGLHPLLWALGPCDLRPLIWSVPALCLLLAGAWRGRPGAVLAGAAWAALCREEAPLLIAAAGPAVLLRRDRGVALAWAAGLAGAAALPFAVWGRASNLATHADPVAELGRLLAGERPLLRWWQEAHFGARCLLAALPALAAPELLLPGIAGWLWLVALSEREPAAPGQGGLHYLAVVAPFVLAAAALGAARLRARLSPGARRAGALLWGALAAAAAGPLLLRAAGWSAGLASPDAHVGQLDELLAPVEADPGGVLADPRVAPRLSGRAVLRIQGHIDAGPERRAAEAQDLRWAVISLEPQPELGAWRESLEGAGWTLESALGGMERWAAPQEDPRRDPQRAPAQPPGTPSGGP